MIAFFILLFFVGFRYLQNLPSRGIILTSSVENVNGHTCLISYNIERNFDKKVISSQFTVDNPSKFPIYVSGNKISFYEHNIKHIFELNGHVPHMASITTDRNFLLFTKSYYPKTTFTVKIKGKIITSGSFDNQETTVKDLGG